MSNSFLKLSESRDPVAIGNLLHCFTLFTLGKGFGEDCLIFIFIFMFFSLGLVFWHFNPTSLVFRICLNFRGIFKLVARPCSPFFSLNSFLLQIVGLCDQQHGAKSGRELDISAEPQWFRRRSLGMSLMAGCVGWTSADPNDCIYLRPCLRALKWWRLHGLPSASLSWLLEGFP